LINKEPRKELDKQNIIAAVSYFIVRSFYLFQLWTIRNFRFLLILRKLHFL